MHGLQTKSNLVETELAKVLREVASAIEDDICEVATFHEFNKNPKAILVVIDFLALDQLFAVEEGDQAALVDDVLPLGI